VKQSRKIIIAAVALLLTVILVLASCKRPGSSDEVVVVTDKNGVPVTDESGEAITVVLETEIVEITNENGEKVYDENGKVKTSVIYHSQNVKVPVTDSEGRFVTDKNGEIKSQLITVPPQVEKFSSVQYFTDPLGSTLFDGNGQPVTNIIEYTTGHADQGGNSANWGTTFGGSANDSYKGVAATPDGGCVAVFQTNSTDGTLQGIAKKDFSVPYIVLTKYDNTGRLKWQKVVGGGNSMIIDGIATDSEGNIALAGYTKSGSLGFQNYGDYDAVLFKLNSSGDVQWVKNFGGSMTDGFTSVCFAPDGGIVAAGLCASSDGSASSLGLGSGQSAALVVKFDASGNQIFAQKAGGSGDSFNGVSVASDGSIYAVGPFTSNTAFAGHGRADAGVAKFNSDGSVAWVKGYGGSQIENFHGITAVNDGCVIAGRSSSNDGDLAQLGNQGEYDAILVKFSSSGDIGWQNAFRGPKFDNFLSIKQLSDGSYVAAGCSASSTRDMRTVGNKGGKDGIIVTFNSSGIMTSVQGYGGTADDEFNSICVLSSGEFVACGSSLSANGDLVGTSAQSDGTNTVGMIAKFK